ncbi:N-hydroxyarylamine O-acetyltransferase [Streptomyces griseochromogenes]|uniref:Acetyltransferase n=1 Tax=Streptomyces griseochromogenes TaxID=68214 RepID=A0A1B1B818_9ACTN|nr:arylamine N-acetyltransferase [Streptomyces griseochromogenes]ANP54976.1 acetyltransferase [Streptomyces griseochromogenes]MBP2050629.1 N-hydroxyarylamine O-acetyltransferase [Streptomyces griseochromogenes]
MNSSQIDAYLRRLGAERPQRPTAEALRELHLLHLRTVPFENLSIHLGEEIVLEEKRLLDKVVEARRGGFCYELNGAFGALLAALGYEVELLAARVYGDEGRLGIPYDHLALRVRTEDGGDWLADVGFGAHSHFPLAFAERGEQADPCGTFRVAEAGPDAAGVRDGGGGAAGAVDLDVVRDGRPEYRLERRPRVLGDFVSGAWWHSTSPQSHFTRSLVCSRVTEDGGRITLSGRKLTTTAAGGRKETRELGTDEEVLAVYRERFGIGLSSVPAVRNRDRDDRRPGGSPPNSTATTSP